MKLSPGVYKLRGGYPLPEHYYLRVQYIGKTIYYDINAGTPSMAQDYNDIPIEGYEIVKKITRPIIKKAEIMIFWTDDEGDEFCYAANDIRVLREFLKSYPEIARAIGSRKY
ncbi:hypothetical protein [Fulvivirga sp.]|uniref:hypothetical protein n=1 Tax=Fulvivirga sp. TaxID=1931237 RepID=UPI0032EFB8A1